MFGSIPRDYIEISGLLFSPSEMKALSGRFPASRCFFFQNTMSVPRSGMQIQSNFLQNIAKDSHAHQRALSSFRIQSGIGAFRDILRFRHANSPQNILVFIYPRIRETHLSQTAAIEPSIFLKNTICQDIPRAPLQSQAAFRQSSHESAFETLQEPVKVSSGIYQSVLGYADSITAASSAQSEMTGAPNERQTSAKRPPIPARRLLPRHIPHMKGFLLSILFRTALFERPSFKRPPLRASLHASLL